VCHVGHPPAYEYMGVPLRYSPRLCIWIFVFTEIAGQGDKSKLKYAHVSVYMSDAFIYDGVLCNIVRGKRRSNVPGVDEYKIWMKQ